MHPFDEEPPPPVRRNTAITIWWALAIVLLGPSLLVLLVRATAYGFSCAPGPGLCHGMKLGGGLRDTLALAWFVGNDTFVALLIGFAAAIAALFARRWLLAGLSVLVMPIAALLLPIFAVMSSTYPGCMPDEAGIGDCTLWGAKMGMSIHHAATAPWLIYAVAPYSVSLGLMIGVIGFLFCRRRAA